MTKAGILVALLLGASSSASPVLPTAGKTHLYKRALSDECIDDLVAEAATGKFFAFGKSGDDTIDCDDIADLKTAEIDDVGNYQPVACPSDPAPSKYPDGSPVGDVADGLIGTFCNSGISLPGLAGDWVTIAGCLLYGYFESGGDEIQAADAGAIAICDAAAEGACTFFTTVAPELSENDSQACSGDDQSDLCGWANPGK